MSLDLVKNALYAALTMAIPSLTVYPEPIDIASEAFPNVSFTDIATENQYARSNWEVVRLANPDQTPGAAPYLIYPVIARLVSSVRLTLRQRLAGNRDAAAYQTARDLHNAVERFWVTTRAVNTVAGETNFAELWYQGSRGPSLDSRSGVYQTTYDVRIDPWRLLDTTGRPTFTADQITVQVIRQADNTILIQRVYPLP